MSSNTANMIVFVLMVLLPLAAMLALEVFLSRRPSWWPGLVLPCSVTLGAFNMIRLFILACLVPSAALFAIYFLNRKKVQQKCAETENGKPQK